MAFVTKNRKLRGDAQLLDLWKRVNDPVQALQEIITSWHFIGSDPYYRDLDSALREMVDRVLSTSTPTTP